MKLSMKNLLWKLIVQVNRGEGQQWHMTPDAIQVPFLWYCEAQQERL